MKWKLADLRAGGAVGHTEPVELVVHAGKMCSTVYSATSANTA